MLAKGYHSTREIPLWGWNCSQKGIIPSERYPNRGRTARKRVSFRQRDALIAVGLEKNETYKIWGVMISN